MSRGRLFIENIIIYGLGTMVSKLIPLLMLPIVTRLMPNSSFFGYSDLSNTLVSLVQPVVVMGMYDAMFRMYFDDDADDYKQKVCSTALYFVLGTALIVSSCLLMLRDSVARIFFGGAEFANLALVSAMTIFVSGGGQIVQAPTRMMNKRLTYIIMNLITAVLSYVIAIPLLISGDFLLALPISALLAAVSSFLVFAVINRKWFSVKKNDPRTLRTMLAIGIPLMPSFLFYWVFSSSSRLIILSVLGAGAAGVFAVAAKIGQVSQLIYNAFAQGWQYFAFSTMKDSDQIELNSRVYEYLAVTSILATGLVIAVMDPIYRALFSADYSDGVVCVPYLFLSPLLLMLYQVAVNQLLIIKNTWPSLVMLAAGAFACIAGQVILVPMLGIEGAAIGMLMGYGVTTVSAHVVLGRLKLLAIRTRLYGITLAFVAYFLLWRLCFMGNTLILCGLLLLLVLLISVQYKDEVKLVWRSILS